MFVPLLDFWLEGLPLRSTIPGVLPLPLLLLFLSKALMRFFTPDPVGGEGVVTFCWTKVPLGKRVSLRDVVTLLPPMGEVALALGVAFLLGNTSLMSSFPGGGGTTGMEPTARMLLLLLSFTGLRFPSTRSPGWRFESPVNKIRKK